MKVAIVEDEMVAARSLEKMLLKCDHEIEICKVVRSVVEAINFFSNEKVDLILMDVQLADGLCFEIFEHIDVQVPVIFTTAYDDFMLKAFKVNSVDYLLKPIHENELRYSLEKFRKHHTLQDTSADLLRIFNGIQKSYKNRFLVRYGRSFVSVNVEDVAYVQYTNKLSYLITFDNKKYTVDDPLEYVETQLDPMKFKRINRNMIVSYKAVKRMESYFNNRMLLILEPPLEEDAIVTRSYLREFRKWMDS